MLSKPVGGRTPVSDITNSIHYPAAATAAVITIAAKENRRAVVHNVQWSYSAAPTGGRLTITRDPSGTAVVILDVDIIAGGPGALSCFKAGTVNAALEIRLTSGAGAIVGKLSADTALDAD